MRYSCNDDGNAYQHPVPAEAWSVPVRELWASTDDEASALVEAETSTAIDITESSVRLVVVHVGDDEHIVMLMVHHIATDGWSDQWVLGDIAKAYNALVSGEAVQLGPEPHIRYADYAHWQHEMLADTALMAPHLEYWRGRPLAR